MNIKVITFMISLYL